MPIELTDDTRRRILESLKHFVAEHLDCEIGELQGRRLLEFMVGHVGATVYNQAIADAQAYLQDKLLDLEGDLHEPVRHAPPR
ncbi:MAG: DUF2164 domain-containing protein [Planctomycetota bacterium]|jgi:uncharacterized protein (DUF2164 family)